jgi:hypothetical protein
MQMIMFPFCWTLCEWARQGTHVVGSVLWVCESKSSCASLTFVRIRQIVSELHILEGLSCGEWLMRTWTLGFGESICWAVCSRTLSFWLHYESNRIEQFKFNLGLDIMSHRTCHNNILIYLGTKSSAKHYLKKNMQPYISSISQLMHIMVDYTAIITHKIQ